MALISLNWLHNW